MKYLLVLVVVMVAFHIWRNNRISEQAHKPPRPPRQKGLAAPVAMVACPVCGTHLPEEEAIRGREGSYCCLEHRQQHEDRPR